MVLHAGSTFAGYTILDMLGSGEMGEVYLAQQPESGRRAALKILHEALTSDSEFRDRFLREAGTVSTLYHPHILEVHDRGEFGGQLWIAMDCVDATNTAELLRQRYPAGMPAGEALAIITAVAAALDYAHQRGLVHRDVKPANILVSNPGDGAQRILLSDFGIARQLGKSSGLTPADLTLSTVSYAAPEQLRGAGVDGRSDQYGLAATAFHLLTGAPPFNYADPLTVVKQRRSAAAPQISERRPDLARLDAVMSTALAENPADRFVGCAEFADALGEAVEVSTGDRSPEAALIPPAAVSASRSGSPDAGETSADPSRHGAAGKPAAPGFLRRSLHLPGRSLSSATRKWPLILVGAVVGAVLVAVAGLLAFGVLNTHKKPEAAAPTASPTTSSRPPTPSAAPTSVIPTALPPAQLLNGAYRVEIDRSRQTYNDTPDPQPPDVSTWWAFRSSCSSTGCVATAVLLDDKNHQTASANGDNHMDFRFVDGAWKSVAQTVPFPCIDSKGRSDRQTTTQMLTLKPGHDVFRGSMTVTVKTNECGQKGAQIVIPAVANRIGGVPPAVHIPNPTTVPDPPAGAGSTPAPPTSPAGGSGTATTPTPGKPGG